VACRAGGDGLKLARDIALVAAAFALCPIVAALAPADPAVPMARGHALVAAERGLGLHFEPAVYAWTASRPTLLAILNFLYIFGHVPATVGALVWARLERPKAFPLARDAFLWTQGVVVAGYLVAPTAPPRMLLGLVDPRASDLTHTVQSPFAAMPSGHVAFAVVAAGIVGSQVRALRWVAPLYPLLVTAIVIATANHLWIDALAGAGAALSGLALAVLARTRSWMRKDRGAGVARIPREHVPTDSPASRRPAGTTASA
jgi:hypothetical protein